MGHRHTKGTGGEARPQAHPHHTGPGTPAPETPEPAELAPIAS